MKVRFLEHIAEQLRQHAFQELSHAIEVTKQILLGQRSYGKGKDAEYSQDSKTMLEIVESRARDYQELQRKNPSGRAFS